MRDHLGTPHTLPWTPRRKSKTQICKLLCYFCPFQKVKSWLYLIFWSITSTHLNNGHVWSMLGQDLGWCQMSQPRDKHWLAIQFRRANDLILTFVWLFSSKSGRLGVFNIQNNKNKAASNITEHVTLFIQQGHRIHFVQTSEGECFGHTAFFST